MSARRIPVACVQTRAYERDDFDTQWPHVLSLVDAAGAGGAKLIVLPEGSVPAYVLGPEPVVPEQLERAAQTLRALARKHGATIVYGTAKIVRDRTFNAAVAIGPDGAELGYAAKQFLWHFDRRWFSAGFTLDPVDTPLGRLGLFVCADGRIPTIAATLVERGAEILVMPTAWVTSGRDPAALENIQADLMANVRARENGVPLVVCNKAGVEAHGVAYCGKSALIVADGTFVARAAEREETILFGEVGIGLPAAARAHVALAAPGSEPAPLVARARIAFTLASEPAEIRRLAELAALADADLLLAGAAFAGPRPAVAVLAAEAAENDCSYAVAAGVRVACVNSRAFYSPRGLAAPRMAGVDLYLWEAEGDAAWIVAFARTRAAELRAYVVAFDREGQRAFAVDPDGAIVAGTFDGYRLAAFAYDRSRAAATTVAPGTDVAAGLRVAEEIRAEGLGAAIAD